MAPTVCLSELPIVRNSVSLCSRRRQRVQNGGILKPQRLELRRMEMNVTPGGVVPLTPPASPLWEPESRNDSCALTIDKYSSPDNSEGFPADLEEQWKVFLARRKGLLDIVVRTIALVRRNNILQRRVNALRAETRDFMRSVLNNPENKCRQQRRDSDCKDAMVTSSTEKVVQRPPLPPTPDSVCSSSNDVSSTCCTSDWDSDESTDES